MVGDDLGLVACCISCIAPKKPEYFDRLCVPLTHSVVARNWNFAISCWSFTASRVANRVATSTPLMLGFSVVTLMGVPPVTAGVPACLMCHGGR